MQPCDFRIGDLQTSTLTNSVHRDEVKPNILYASALFVKTKTIFKSLNVYEEPKTVLIILSVIKSILHMSRDMRFPTMCIRAV